ncbi:transcriptional regulator [Bordetella genomosp. 9]|nr:transcriptional regulator [Bordetella genomosp. 9]
MSNEVQPKCPSCDVKGIDHITSADSAQQSNGGDAWFNVAYCNECGHVYGVFAKRTFGPSPLRVPGL